MAIDVYYKGKVGEEVGWGWGVRCARQWHSTVASFQPSSSPAILHQRFGMVVRQICIRRTPFIG